MCQQLLSVLLSFVLISIKKTVAQSSCFQVFKYLFGRVNMENYVFFPLQHN